MTEQDTREQLTDNFMKYERMEGRTLTIDGAEFADTREKLEADVRRTLNDSDDWHAWVQYNTALEWLNRQAAITARECESVCKSCEDDHDSLVAQMAEESADLQSQLEEVTRAYKERGDIIAKLTAKRDELKAFADRVRNAVIKGNDLTIFGADYVPADAYYSALGAANAIAQRAVDLRNEVNQLRKVVQTQADSFAKLERELAMAKEEQQ